MTGNGQEHAGNEPAYAIRSSLYATFIGLASLVAVSLSAAALRDIGLGGLCSVGAFLPIAAIPIVLVCDQWPSREWSRIIVSALQLISLVLGLASLALFFLFLYLIVRSGGEFLAPNSAALSGGLLGMAINSFVVTWFIRNRELFKG